jgi:protein SCO1/2
MESKGEVGKALIGGSFELIDTNGKTFTDQDLIGKYYLLYFGFTHCPDICPEELSKIAEVIELVKKTIPEAPIVPVFVSCDPERDSPPIIKSYLQGKRTIYY